MVSRPGRDRGRLSPRATGNHCGADPFSAAGRDWAHPFDRRRHQQAHRQDGGRPRQAERRWRRGRDIEPGAEESVLRSCTLADIPLVGPKFQARLARHGLITVEDVLRHDLPALERWMSKREAQWLWHRVHGRDEGNVYHPTMNRGISRDETFGKDLREDTDIERELLRLVTRAAADMRGDGLTARTVAVRLRDWDFKTRSAQRTLPEPVVSDRVILRVAHELLTSLRNTRRVPARLVGVRLSGLAPAKAAYQIAILSEETERDRGLAHAIDRVRGKFGAKSILPGGIVKGD